MKHPSAIVIINLVLFGFFPSYAASRAPHPAKKLSFPAVASAEPADPGKAKMPIAMIEDITTMVQDIKNTQDQIIRLQENLAKKPRALESKAKELFNQTTIEY